MTKKLIVLTVSIFFLALGRAQATKMVATICSRTYSSLSECQSARSSTLQANPNQSLSQCQAMGTGGEYNWCVIGSTVDPTLDGSLIPTDDEEDYDCLYDSQTACQSATGVSTCLLNKTTNCYAISKCKTGYYLNTSVTLNGTPLCMACPTNGTCNGSTVTCNSGYTLSSTSPDVTPPYLVGTKFCVKDETDDDTGSGSLITPVDDENTVSSCPSGLSKSADGCCCVK